MTPNKEVIKKRFDELAIRFHSLRQEIDQLLPYLSEEMDRTAAENIQTDLAWAAETASTIGLHIIGKSLDDRMEFNPH